MLNRIVKGQMMSAVILGSVMLFGQQSPQVFQSLGGDGISDFYETKHRRG